MRSDNISCHFSGWSDLITDKAGVCIAGWRLWGFDCFALGALFVSIIAAKQVADRANL
jgi:hypothetical protein